MKKFINILLAAAVTALAVVSCQKEEQVKPGTPDPEGCYGVYFPVQEATGSHTYDPDMDRSVTFTVARTNTSGAITVPFTVVSEDKDVFEFGDIEFADGQAETELEVTFDDIEEGKTCSFSIQLNDDNAYVSHYNSGAIALDFSVIVVKWEYILNPKTGEKALFEFTQDYWGETAWAYVKYYEVDGVRYCHTESTGQHVYKEPYEAPGFFGTADDLDTDGELYFNFKHEPHIKDTRRAFITGDSVECYYDNEDEDIVACVNVKQAWAFAADDGGDLKKWQEISNEYNVDIRLFGIEMGMEFTQEVIIIRGQKPIVNEKQYEDWMWECPFPNMGG